MRQAGIGRKLQRNKNGESPHWVIFKNVFAATFTSKHRGKPCLFPVNIEKDDRCYKIINTVESLLYANFDPLYCLFRSVVFIFRMKMFRIVSLQ